MPDPQAPLRVFDLVAILVYLCGTIGITLYFARRNTSTEEYFVGGRSFPGWVIGLSHAGHDRFVEHLPGLAGGGLCAGLAPVERQPRAAVRGGAGRRRVHPLVDVGAAGFSGSTKMTRLACLPHSARICRVP